ncbi:site-specific integrase [Marinimicrobium sp. ABcell2]|uniref:site-specific integrase n=1 Tax=Marinimicrobium sp. ABcell2 TaxID=3069751 RepID=UPI0027B47626|nr:site-specific integrase [Marinimicrobium sp. ABcell2]MDQ2077623.1 site-specific integrase [Marinimicrobium sp. ABcell2]
MAKITKRLVDASEPKKARYYVWDESLPGFGLVIQPSGTKSFCFQYRTPEGQTRRISLGRFGSVTPEQARTKAKGFQSQVNQGGDPLGEKRTRRAALKVSDILDRYLASAKFGQKTDTTQSIDRGRIERHLKPLLGNKIADKLTVDVIWRAYADIVAGKTATTVKTGPRGLARVKGGEGAARMSIRLLKSAYSWATEEGLLSVNVAASVKVSQDGRRQAVLAPEDYQALFQAIDDLESVAALNSVAGDAVRVIALTGARRGEIAGLRWRHVDLKKGIAILSSGEHKTGRKTGDSRTIGLPAAAQAIISRQRNGKPDDYIFPPARGEGPISLSKPWRLIRDKAGLDSSIVLHSLRHSLATSMAVNGAEAAHIMAVMGHKDLATSQKYIHIAKDMRADMAERAASGISAAMNGSAPAKVVKLTGAKN